MSRRRRRKSKTPATIELQRSAETWYCNGIHDAYTNGLAKISKVW